MQNIIKERGAITLKKVFQVLSLSRFITSLSNGMPIMNAYFSNISNTTIGRRQSEGGVECDEKNRQV